VLSVDNYLTVLATADFNHSLSVLLLCLMCTKSLQLYTALYKDGEQHTTSDDKHDIQHMEQSNTDDSNDTTSNCADSTANKTAVEAAAAEQEDNENDDNKNDDTQYRIRSFSDAESEKLLLCSKTVSNQSKNSLK
jgi:hypothetical protein